MLMFEEFAERQNRNEINRQVKTQASEDERLQDGQMNSILHQRHAEMASLRSHLVQEGELSRDIIKLTRAQTNTPLIEMAQEIGRFDSSVWPSTNETQALLQRKLIWTTSDTSRVLPRNKFVNEK